jgi:hypothetical protein
MKGKLFLTERRAGTFNGSEVILSKVARASIAHIKGCVAGGLAKNEAAANSCKLARPKRCKKVRCGEAQTAACPCEFLHKLEIAERHDKAALISVEKVVDFRLTDRLLKGDAGAR